MDIGKTIQDLAIFALPLILAVSLHEAAHGFVANRLGDPTARILGRLTLNPFRHVDLWGTIIIPLILIISKTGIILGYAKPVPVNPFNFKDPKRDMAWVAYSGPITNFTLAFISGVIFRGIFLLFPELNQSFQMGATRFMHHGIATWFLIPLVLMLQFSVQINVVLGVFNLLPIPPLDGGRIMMGILPDRQAKRLGQIEPWGFFIIVLLIILDPFRIMSHWVYGVMGYLFKIFLFAY